MKFELSEQDLEDILCALRTRSDLIRAGITTDEPCRYADAQRLAALIKKLYTTQPVKMWRPVKSEVTE